MPTRFRDRREAGQRFGDALARYANRRDVTVLALPRGGVPVGFEVARRLGVPLDIILVRKLGIPGHDEYAMGAIASGGVLVRNREAIAALGIPERLVTEVAARESHELARRESAYRGDRPAPDVAGRTVILVDDGLATGSTMRAAIEAMRHLNAAHIVVAVPVAAPSTCAEMRRLADECVCVMTPEPFVAVGMWYEDFDQTTDDEVRHLLRRADAECGPSVAHAGNPLKERSRGIR